MTTRKKVIMILLSYILIIGVFSYVSWLIISLKLQLYNLDLSSFVKLPVKLALQEIDDDFRNNHNDRAYMKYTILKKRWDEFRGRPGVNDSLSGILTEFNSINFQSITPATEESEK